MLLSLLIVTWSAVCSLRANSLLIPDSSVRGLDPGPVFYDMSFHNILYASPDSKGTSPQMPKQCGLRMAPMVGDIPSKSVLLLGCSLDANALISFCASVGSKMYGNPFQGRFCKAGNSTMAMIFHPGSGEPPYFSPYMQFLAGQQIETIPSTHDIITTIAPAFTQSIMGPGPDLVVVDDSLWSLSKWWEHNYGGDPNVGNQKSFPIPRKEIQQWCHDGLKLHMGLVAATYPNSQIAFRTAPTVMKPIVGQTAEAVDIMQECIRAQTKGGLLFGKYPVIQYHDMVDRRINSAKEHGESVQELYCDDNHPGPDLSQAYAQMIWDVLRK